MLGIIVTGHGEFSYGISSSLKLIAGEVKNYRYVNFLEGAAADDLLDDIMKAINELSECETIVICCDLAGGSPYKCALQCSLLNEKIKVVAGINFPTLLELSMGSEEDSEKFLDRVIESGRNQLFVFDKEAFNQN